MGILDVFEKRSKQEENKFPDELETLEEYKSRWRSIYVIYCTMFVVCLSLTTVFTGIWPYLDKIDPTAGKTYLGYIVGINPLAQLLFAPLLGWWCNKIGSIRIPLIATILLGVIANILYSSLELLPVGTKYWMLASRFLIGISSACLAGLRTYLSAATRQSERRKAIAMFSLFQVLGFIAGPAVQAIIVPLGNDGLWIIPNHLRFNMYTAVGWFNVLLALCNVYLLLPNVFQEHEIAKREEELKQTGLSSPNSSVPKFAAWVLITYHFIIGFSFMIVETLGTAIVMDHFAFTKAEALSFMGIMMSVGACLTIICYIVVDPLCRRFGEMGVLIWGGLFVMCIGRFLYIPMSSSAPQTFNEDYRLEILNNFTICRNDIKTNPSVWNITTDQLHDTNYLSKLCNYTEIVGCPNSQKWCETTSAITITQFIIGTTIIIVSYPIATTLIQTLFSRTLGTKPQGIWMGYMVGSGALSRIMGPVLLSYVYTEYGPNWAFGSAALILFCSMVYLWIYADIFVVMNSDEHVDKKLLGNETSVINCNKSDEMENLTQEATK